MQQIFLPKYFVCGNNSFEKISLKKYRKMIVISDLSEHNSRLQKILSYVRENSLKTEVVLKSDIEKIYSYASNCFLENNIDCIVAVGGPSVIDCGMLLSTEKDAFLIAVPETLLTGVTDFSKFKYSEYYKIPEAVILDFYFIGHTFSAAVAYNGMASLALAFYVIKNTKVFQNKELLFLARKGFAGITNNIISAYRGDIKARYGLSNSMYLCTAAFINSSYDENSLTEKTIKFFEQFGYNKLSLYAECFPNIMEYEMKSELYFSDWDFVEKIRKLQAILGIPRSAASLSLDEKRYLIKKEQSDLPPELLDLCYYGSFKHTSI